MRRLKQRESARLSGYAQNAHIHAVAATGAVVSLEFDIESLAHGALGKRLIRAKKCDLALHPCLGPHVPRHFHPSLWPCVGQLQQSQRMFFSCRQSERSKCHINKTGGKNPLWCARVGQTLEASTSGIIAMVLMLFVRLCAGRMLVVPECGGS